MMTEVIEQKVRPRRSSFSARGYSFFRTSILRISATRVLESLRVRARSLLWRTKMRGIRVTPERGPGSLAARIIRRTRIHTVLPRRSIRRIWYIFFGAVFILYFCYILFGNALSSLSAREPNFELPSETDVESFLYAYIEPPVSDVLEGEISPPDSARFRALSLSTHRIARGETISGIAQRHGLNLDTVVSLNGIEDVRRIPVGAELKLPNQNGILYTVRRGDSLSGISRAFDIGMNALADVNNLDSSTIHPGQDLFIPGARMKPMELRKILGELFVYPTVGRMTSGFGPRNDPFTGVRRFHNGIDIAGPIGTPVFAAMAGKIVKIGVHPSYGRYIIMSHPSGYQTWYAHLNKAVVPVGSTVSQGEMIGEMGNTGYSTGSHLHFSVFKNGNPVDPMRFLR